MPSGSGAEDLPEPPAGIELVELPARKVAVVSFAGRANDRLLARIHASEKQYSEAVAKFDALLKSGGKDEERAALFYEKGEVLQLSGDIAGAVAAYKQSLEQDAKNWNTLNNVAYILSDLQGQHDAALPFARSAVAAADNPSTLDTLGWIYVSLKRYDEAVAELSRAIRLDPGYVLASYHLGEAYRRAGRFDEAVQVLQSAAEPARARKDTDLSALIETSLSKARSRDGNV